MSFAKVTWLSPASGDFGDAGDWSGGAVPNAADAVVLTGGAFTVTVSQAETVGSMMLGGGVTLDVESGFTDVHGTGAKASAGIVLVGASGTFTFSGALVNNGQFEVKGDLSLKAAGTISGTGVLLMEGGEITGAVSGKRQSILSMNGDLSGYGAIGGAYLTNNGVITASGGTLSISESQIYNYGNINISAGSKGDLSSQYFINKGTITSNGGDVTVESLYGGAVDIDGGVFTQLGQSSGINCAFILGSDPCDIVINSEEPDVSLSNFSTSSTLDLRSVNYSTTLSYWKYSGTVAAGILTVGGSAGSVSSVLLVGDYIGVNWVLSSDAPPGTGGGTLVMEAAPGAISRTAPFIGAMAALGPSQAHAEAAPATHQQPRLLAIPH